jgi:hypothetical protein
LEQELTSARKKAHIDLAFQSQVSQIQSDQRFYYEPLLSAHPKNIDLQTPFGSKTLGAPIWVSSMTGTGRHYKPQPCPRLQQVWHGYGAGQLPHNIRQ